MASTETCNISTNGKHEKEEPLKPTDKYKDIISKLPSCPELPTSRLYEGFWNFTFRIEGLMLAQEQFQAKSSDIFLCSFPKSGTTWLKSLAFAIATRKRFTDSENPLFAKSPHECIPFIELQPRKSTDPELPIMAAHSAYTSLPSSIITSGSKIIYICRDPKDVIVSLCSFSKNIPNYSEADDIGKYVDLFCRGIVSFGPYWEHVLGYWKASLERPDKVLFLKYEEMKEDTVGSVKKIAELMGYGFDEEESGGEVERIVSLCSFENLSNLETNKKGEYDPGTGKPVEKGIYFRKGKVGDWKNHLSEEMAERIDEITKEKFSPFGLCFS